MSQWQQQAQTDSSVDQLNAEYQAMQNRAAQEQQMNVRRQNTMGNLSWAGLSGALDGAYRSFSMFAPLTVASMATVVLSVVFSLVCFIVYGTQKADTEKYSMQVSYEWWDTYCEYNVETLFTYNPTFAAAVALIIPAVCYLCFYLSSRGSSPVYSSTFWRWLSESLFTPAVITITYLAYFSSPFETANAVSTDQIKFPSGLVATGTEGVVLHAATVDLYTALTIFGFSHVVILLSAFVDTTSLKQVEISKNLLSVNGLISALSLGNRNTGELMVLWSGILLYLPTIIFMVKSAMVDKNTYPGLYATWAFWLTFTAFYLQILLLAQFKKAMSNPTLGGANPRDSWTRWFNSQGWIILLTVIPKVVAALLVGLQFNNNQNHCAVSP